MSKTGKIVAGVLTFYAVVVLAGFVLMGSWLYGTTHRMMAFFDHWQPGVEVEMPGAVLDVGGLLEKIAEETRDVDVRVEIAPLRPLLRAVGRELDRLEDGVLVEVWADGERVGIVKYGEFLKLEIDGRDGRVRVRLPLDLVRGLVRALDSIALSGRNAHV